MNVFDIIGPVMIGPSSSHTAGAVRLGRVANKLIDDRELKRVEITLSGSFAQTYKGHGTDRALLAGALGLPEQEDILMLMDLGYAAEGTGPLPNHDKRKPLSETVSYL